MKVRVLALLMALLAACTSVDYRSPEFAAQTRDHELIAVLPFEMIFTGKAPKNLTGAQILAIEEAESVAFQTSFYHRLLNRSSAGRKNPILIAIQPIGETNRLLAASGIDLRQSWTMDPKELAGVLGVDAVVRTSVHKTRYLSDLASFGIELGYDVLLHEISDGEISLIPVGLVKTHDIWADSSLVDGETGRLLWEVALEREADWTNSANEVIQGVTKKLAKKFPYRGA